MFLRWFRVFSFLTRAFAVIGFLVVALLIIGLSLAAYETRPPREPDSVILTLDLDRDVVEQNESSALDLALSEKDNLALLDIIMAVDRARLDPHVKGLVAYFGGAQPSLAQAEEIRAAILRFRSSGKLTYAFGTSYGDFGLGNRTYYVASSFENIWLQPVGAVSLTGLAIQSPFAKTALDKLGIKADFMQREEYKSFMEMAMRDDFSPPVKTLMQGLIDNLADQIAGGIAENLKLKNDQVHALMVSGPYTANEAMTAHLVTRLGYSDELDEELKKKGGDAEQVDLETYMSYAEDNKNQEKASPSKIALIYGTGLIVSQPVGLGDMSGEKVMNSHTLAEAFDDVADDKDIKAILFRIDSPGGSPDASETIRHALVHAQKKGKPVFVSMGSVAASGGYWIAMNADHIVADPGTLTGSIGVVAGKFAFGGLMKKVGVNLSTLTTDENAGLWSMVDEFSPSQRARVNAMLDDTYQAFVQGVSLGRHIPMEKMPGIAKGRVWSGEQAAKIGLVDELGGYDVTLAALRKHLGLTSRDEIILEEFPRPLSATEKLLKMIKGFGVEGAMVRSMLIDWRGVREAFLPLWQETRMGRVTLLSAEAPPSLTHVVQ